MGSSWRLSNPEKARAEVIRILNQELERAGIRRPTSPGHGLSAEDQALRQHIHAAAAEFLKQHSEFFVNEENEARMHEYMSITGLAFDLVGYEKAYAAIRSGLDAKPTTKPTKRATPERSQASSFPMNRLRNSLSIHGSA